MGNSSSCLFDLVTLIAQLTQKIFKCIYITSFRQTGAPKAKAIYILHPLERIRTSDRLWVKY